MKMLILIPLICISSCVSKIKYIKPDNIDNNNTVKNIPFIETDTPASSVDTLVTNKIALILSIIVIIVAFLPLIISYIKQLFRYCLKKLNKPTN